MRGQRFALRAGADLGVVDHPSLVLELLGLPCLDEANTALLLEQLIPPAVEEKRAEIRMQQPSV